MNLTSYLDLDETQIERRRAPMIEHYHTVELTACVQLLLGCRRSIMPLDLQAHGKYRWEYVSDVLLFFCPSTFELLHRRSVNRGPSIQFDFLVLFGRMGSNGIARSNDHDSTADTHVVKKPRTDTTAHLDFPPLSPHSEFPVPRSLSAVPSLPARHPLDSTHRLPYRAQPILPLYLYTVSIQVFTYYTPRSCTFTFIFLRVFLRNTIHKYLRTIPELSNTLTNGINGLGPTGVYVNSCIAR
ncbi:hypothetical protein WN55_10340 [Dufourea novaeangliae]|uniref:Uncharacterized protein n=1 Tax=Dufourea novaeangliae TaxID=178035 RepID=A0A154P5M6_DUFNO|nr:hypothetical protein WN55_10340 [Dufourea novaeangliae]